MWKWIFIKFLNYFRYFWNRREFNFFISLWIEEKKLFVWIFPFIPCFELQFIFRHRITFSSRSYNLIREIKKRKSNQSVFFSFFLNRCRIFRYRGRRRRSTINNKLETLKRIMQIINDNPELLDEDNVLSPQVVSLLKNYISFNL